MGKVFIVNGYARAGKDEFVNHIRKISPLKIKNYSTIDIPKHIYLRVFGEDNEYSKKTPLYRKRLSDIKIALSEKFEYFLFEIEKLIKENDIVFVHAREPENIKRIVEVFEAKTIYIINDKAKTNYLKGNVHNIGDDSVENYEYDYYIHNNDTLETYYNTIENFLKTI